MTYSPVQKLLLSVCALTGMYLYIASNQTVNKLSSCIKYIPISYKCRVNFSTGGRIGYRSPMLNFMY